MECHDLLVRIDDAYSFIRQFQDSLGSRKASEAIFVEDFEHIEFVLKTKSRATSWTGCESQSFDDASFICASDCVQTFDSCIIERREVREAGGFDINELRVGGFFFCVDFLPALLEHVAGDSYSEHSPGSGCSAPNGSNCSIAGEDIRLDVA